jgi:hypothetical protein
MRFLREVHTRAATTDVADMALGGAQVTLQNSRRPKERPSWTRSSPTPLVKIKCDKQTQSE